MKKKVALLIILVIIVLSGAILFFLANKKTTSTDPADYKKCVDSGGVTITHIAPSSCLINGNKYYDGNY